ncbi:hypothetical protein [Helicobacter sp. 23-1045]
MINFALKYLKSKTTTFECAIQSGEISKEIEIYPTKNILFCGNGIFEFGDVVELDCILKEQISKEIYTMGGGIRYCAR